MILHINEPIDEQHFQGTFQFPNDLDFIGVQTERQCFVDLFNKEIERRVNDAQYNYFFGKEESQEVKQRTHRTRGLTGAFTEVMPKPKKIT